MAAELDVLKKRRIKAVFFIIGSYFFGADGRPMPRAKELLGRVVKRRSRDWQPQLLAQERLDEGAYRDDRRASTPR